MPAETEARDCLPGDIGGSLEVLVEARSLSPATSAVAHRGAREWTVHDVGHDRGAAEKTLFSVPEGCTFLEYG